MSSSASTRLCTLILAALVTLLVTGSYTAYLRPEFGLVLLFGCLTLLGLLIASFNIQVFGQSKLSKPQVVEILAQVARQFDIVAIQEVRAKVFPNTMAIGSRRYFGMMNPAPLPIAVLADAGGDLFAFETIPSLAEAELLLDLLPEFPGVRAWLSFSCRDHGHVAHGEPFADCARRAADSPQVLAVGVNCTAPEHIAPLLRAAAGIDRPLVAYPNSGEEWDAEAQRWCGEACDRMDVAEWHRLGARLIGGCCRTVASDIARMKQSLRESLTG